MAHQRPPTGKRALAARPPNSEAGFPMTLHRRHVLAGLGALATPLLSPAQSASSGTALSAADLRHAQALRELGLKDSLAYALTESLVTEVGARPAG